MEHPSITNSDSANSETKSRGRIGDRRNQAERNLLWHERIMPSRLCRLDASIGNAFRIGFRPIFRRQQHTPNVLRLIQGDTAESRLIVIDIDHRGPCAFTRQNDMNLDPHANSQFIGSRNKGTVAIDHLSLALAAVQGFSNALSLDCNLQANSRASSTVTS